MQGLMGKSKPMNGKYHQKELWLLKNIYLCTYNFEQALNGHQRTTIDKSSLLKRY